MANELDEKQEGMAVALLTKNMMKELLPKVTEISEIYVKKFNNTQTYELPDPKETFVYNIQCEVTCEVLYQIRDAILNHVGDGNGRLKGYDKS